jgi:hypothetical protein
LRGRARAPALKYADRPRPLDRARLPSDASATRRRLLRAHGLQAADALFKGDLATEESLGLHGALEELRASTKLVCVFTADVENGIHVSHWGEAHLEVDRTFTRPYREQMLVAPVSLSDVQCPRRRTSSAPHVHDAARPRRRTVHDVEGAGPRRPRREPQAGDFSERPGQTPPPIRVSPRG